MVKVCKTDLNINSVDKTLQKQRILEKSFAKLNAELFKKEANNKNNERKPKNIFMDILKIPPVIDLANMDETGNPGTSVKQSQSQIQQTEHHDDLILLSTTTGEQSKKAVNSPRKRSNLRLIGKKRRQLRSLKRKLDKMTEEAGFVVQSSPPLPVVNSISAPNLSITQGGVASSSTISDVDLREETGLNKTVRQSKQIAVQKLKEHFSIVEDINDEISIIKCSSDLDLRKESQQESKPSTSTNADISIIYTNDQLLTIRSQQQSRKKSFEKELINYNTFSNRIRFKHRSIQIDLSKNYKLVGLRYFQEILGKEVSVSDKFIQVPLTVVSFNVLCQHYVGAMPHLYKHLDAKGVIYASWSYRAKKLKEEFDRVDADVFCLQEVQDDHFVEFYRPYFKKRNFCGVFTRKTGGLSTPDGCAIFWRQSKLTLLHLTSVTNNLKSFNNPSIGQVALFGLNESVNSNSAICISNTHIYYNMKKGIVKLAQIAYLLGHMKKVENEFLASMKSEQELNKKTNFAGHILCGDFNIEPFSPLHDFLLEQKINLRLNPSKLAFKNTSFDSVDICSIFGTPPPLLSLPLVEMYLSTNSEIVDPNDSSFGKHLFKPNGERLTHDFSFASVYEYLNVNNEPEISSYHCDVSSPDFIFYTVPKCNNVQTFKEDPNVEITEQQLAVEGLIQLRKRLSLPTKAELNKACGKLPNEHYGSDHLLLYAHFDIFCPLADFSFT